MGKGIGAREWTLSRRPEPSRDRGFPGPAIRGEQDDIPSHHSVEANRRPAAAFVAGSKFGSPFFARPWFPAAVAHLRRAAIKRCNNMGDYQIIDTNADNISACSLCGNKHANNVGHRRKTNSLTERYTEGLRYKDEIQDDHAQEV